MGDESNAIRLEPVTAENSEEVFALDPGEDRRHFVASNTRSVAQAYVYEAAEPYAVFAGETMVGFVMLYPFQDDEDRSVVTLARMMIDHRYQRRGLGRLTMLEVIRSVRERPGVELLQLSVIPDNEAAIGLYEAVGFTPTGEMSGPERVFWLPLE